jgi:hypothetical protein
MDGGPLKKSGSKKGMRRPENERLALVCMWPARVVGGPLDE